ncbi:hypothetical protein POM88_004783 [Heracleum sosnowskyi]|uniref:TF-B3 domain-containing protein n=1 Tax=Heracleum sosnowskyi TaxID=360622 RepID=A0AAD8JKZ5_9APIA|nr:hypothetical protein POM88_004783 [Heracleum sosnowskyi]
MWHYCVRPYSMVAFQYKGGSSFTVNIFNEYAMEISYPLFSTVEKEMIPNVIFKLGDNEVDQLNGTFIFNAYNSSVGDYDLLIEKEHLKRKQYHKVFGNDAISALGLHPKMNSIKIGFKSIMFTIKLKWLGGMVFIGKGWHSFAEAGELRKGDVCVFQRTRQRHKFEIALFEKKSVSRYCRIEGIGPGNTLKKWFKIINESTYIFGEMEIPRLFVQNYGWTVADDVKLVMGDRTEYMVKFSSGRKVLHGMRKFLRTYSIEENFVLVFTYVAISTFSVCVYDKEGNFIPPKGTINFKGMNGNNSEAEMNEGRMVNEQDNVTEFTVIIKASHIDQKGHGVDMEEFRSGEIALQRPNMEGSSTPKRKDVPFQIRLEYFYVHAEFFSWKETQICLSSQLQF